MIVLLFIVYTLFGGFFQAWFYGYEECFTRNKIVYFNSNNELITPFFENIRVVVNTRLLERWNVFAYLVRDANL